MRRTNTKIFDVHVQVSDFWKAEDDNGVERMRVGGIATTEGMDRDDERVLQDGLNFKPFLDFGYFNDDHRPGTMLGWPETAKLVKRGDRLPSGKVAKSKGWWVDGYLIDTPRGREVWENAEALERQNAPRRMGMSVEGKIKRRLGSTIAVADVHEVAITKKPVNTGTCLGTLAKSMDAGHQDPTNDPEAESGAPLRRELLEGAPKVMIKACKTKEDWKKALEKSGLSKSDFEKSLSKMEGGYAARFKKAMEGEDYKEEEASKSFELEILETDIEDLEAALAKSSGPLETIDTDSLNTDAVREMEELDVSGLIKSMTDSTRQGFRSAAAGNEALRRMVEVQGKLTTRLAKSLIESRRGQEEMLDEVMALRKSVAELGNSPAMRRGAQTKPEAEALGRFAKSEGEEGAKGIPEGYLAVTSYQDVQMSLEKSMQEAEKLGDRQKLDHLGFEAIRWNRAKNQGIKIIPKTMAAEFGYTPTAN